MTPQPLPKQLQVYVRAWWRRRLARFLITASSLVLVTIRYAGLDNWPGRVVLTILVFTNSYDVLFSARRELAEAFRGPPSRFVALASREVKYTLVAEVIEYLGALTVAARLAHHCLDGFDRAMLAFLAAAALFVRFILRRLAKQGGAEVQAFVESAFGSRLRT